MHKKFIMSWVNGNFGGKVCKSLDVNPFCTVNHGNYRQISTKKVSLN